MWGVESILLYRFSDCLALVELIGAGAGAGGIVVVFAIFFIFRYVVWLVEPPIEW